MTFVVDFIVLIIGFIAINYLFNFILKFLNSEFRDYLKNTQGGGLFHLKLFSYFILVYFLYKNDFINFDSIFITNDKLRHFFNIPSTTKIIYTIIVFFVCRTIIFLVNSFNDFQKLTFSKPNTLINNYIKVFNFLVFVSGFILFISIWMEVRVISLIAGLSTASAVFALIFRDFILGVITSITSANSNIARIGDYISLEKHNIKGTIIDITITNVKLKGDDDNIISFPSYWLINDIMKNRWVTKEEHIKHIELDFFVPLSSLSKISLYDIEKIIMSNENFFNERNIIISFDNERYNVGCLKCDFFINLKEYKEIEETKLKIYSSVGDYLNNLDVLIEKTYH